MSPIFILVTRSFLLGVLPALATLLDVVVALTSNSEVSGPVAALLAFVLGADPSTVHQWMLSLSPIFALIVAHQRRGKARPYTVDPKAR